MSRQNQATDAVNQPRSLLIHSAGLCCSVGYHLNAAVRALRANMDHFQASGFYSLTSEPINVAALPDEIYGEERMKRWVQYALRDCAAGMDDAASLFCARRTAIIVLAPDHYRTHAEAAAYADIVLSVMENLREEQGPSEPVQSAPLPYRITTLSQGRTGLAQALLNAARHLVNDECEQVLIISVDSYLNAGDINAHLREERLFVPGNSNGFVPGEAAAAVLLRPADAEVKGLHIKGVGIAHERGRHDGSVPSRGQGLTEAIRGACNQAKVAPTDLVFRISDQNGEQFFSNEGANAIARVTFGGRRLKQLTLADKIGEVGAAGGIAMLAWLMCDMQQPEISPGNIGLLHLANDNGDRCAIVLRHNSEG